ncbi:MAG TPA: YifB family Mg chelatase-like AAA ATPase [Acidimicrobiales bacterium]
MAPAALQIRRTGPAFAAVPSPRRSAMLATVPSATLVGVDGFPVTVEVHVARGLPCFTVVGLPDTSCREARDRVRAALLTSGFSWPDTRTTVNLAPSSVRKIGSALDLAIAVAVLVASGQLPAEAVGERAFVGELGLDGSLRPVPGALSLVDAVEAEEVVVPPASVTEVSLLRRHRVRTSPDLKSLVDAMNAEAPWPPLPDGPLPPPEAPPPDLADVRGHPMGRLAVEVAAAGGHHLLMIGPPGGGKTMLAQRLPGLLPDLDDAQALETTRVHSAAGLALPGGLVRRPPLRAPHHGVSSVAMVGGGSARLRPGEASLAHGGVLFLDELGEFTPMVLDSLRQPLEDGYVTVSRAEIRVRVPARVLLVAAMNPCPCGEGTTPAACRCSDRSLERYRRRVSGPLLDRFDLRVEILRPDPHQLLHGDRSDPTALVAERVAAARRRAAERGVRANAELPGPVLDELAPLTPDASALAERALVEGRLTARGLTRVRRVALTLADLAGHDGPLRAEHVAGAFHLRSEPSFVAGHRVA